MKFLYELKVKKNEEITKLRKDKINMNQKYIYKKPKNNIIIKLLILFDLLRMILSPNKNIIFAYNSYDIKLKIKGTGNKKVFNQNYCSWLGEYNSYYPDKVIINGKEQNIVTHSYYLNETDNLITLVFNNKLKNCCSMFSGCSDIYEMDFSNFDITEVTYMNSMFSGCSSLISLNLFNFGNSEVKCTCSMFSGCTNLNYINLGNFNETTIWSGHFNGMFSNVPSNVVICLNPTANIIKSKLTQKCSNFICTNDWSSNQKKIAGEECYYNDCSEHDTLKMEYNGQCYQTCPHGTYQDETDSFKNKCKCELEKCRTCPQEALVLNLCEKCHTGFYPMENDIKFKGKYFECYKEIHGYYLDEINSIFKKCYKTCETCDKKGDDNNHNCLSCKSDFKYELNLSNHINCYTVQKILLININLNINAIKNVLMKYL